MQIPEEFHPRKDMLSAEDDNDVLGVGLLFDGSEAECLENTDFEDVDIADRIYHLRLPPDVGTLFAHRVWSGAKLLARFLAHNAVLSIENKTTVELGAGTALPSLVALSHGSRASVITDYPDENVLQSIRETVGANWKTCKFPLNRVKVVEHEWGANTENVIQALKACNINEECGRYFDVAILSECLWMHRCHPALIQSIDKLLHPRSGIAVLTYAHHVPGCEEADDRFFELAGDIGLQTTHHETHDLEYMWDNTKKVKIHLKVLARKQI